MIPTKAVAVGPDQGTQAPTEWFLHSISHAVVVPHGHTNARAMIPGIVTETDIPLASERAGCGGYCSENVPPLSGRTKGQIGEFRRAIWNTVAAIMTVRRVSEKSLTALYGALITMPGLLMSMQPAASAAPPGSSTVWVFFFEKDGSRTG